MSKRSLQSIVDDLTTTGSNSKITIDIFQANGKLYPKNEGKTHEWIKGFFPTQSTITDRDRALLGAITFHLERLCCITPKKLI